MPSNSEQNIEEKIESLKEFISNLKDVTYLDKIDIIDTDLTDLDALKNYVTAMDLNEIKNAIGSNNQTMLTGYTETLSSILTELKDGVLSDSEYQELNRRITSV